MRHVCIKRYSLPVILVAALAGCTGNGLVTRMTPPTDVLIALNDPSLKDGAKARVSHTGLLEHEEYARFEGGGLTLEAIYDVVIGDQVVLDYHLSMARMLDTWNANAGQPIRRGEEKTIQGWHGPIDYQLYTQTASGRSCAGFSAEWDLSARDPFGRPTEVFFGYVCAAKGMALPAARVEALLKSVRIDQRIGGSFVKPGMRASIEEKADAIATGRAEPGTGNNQFPFSFGTTYSEGDGNDFTG